MYIKAAQQADETIKLADRLFVVLNKADKKGGEHGRDCHRDAKDEFVQRGISEKRIFFCSPHAELKGGDKGTAFEMSQEEAEAAKEKVGNYYRDRKPTSGLPEFRHAIRQFVRSELLQIEEEAFQGLVESFNLKCRRLTDFMGKLEDSMRSRGSATPEEKRKFDELWAPHGVLEGTDGLAPSILRALEKTANNLRKDKQALKSFRTDVERSIGELEQKMCNHLTVDAFDKELTLGSGPGRVIDELKGPFRSRQRRRLKEMIPQVSQSFYDYTAKALELLWETIRNCSHEGSDYQDSNLARIPELPQAFLGPEGYMRQLSPWFVSEDMICSGYSAILQCCAYSAAEYLVVRDKGWEDKANDLRAKIDRLRMTLEEN